MLVSKSSNQNLFVSVLPKQCSSVRSAGNRRNCRRLPLPSFRGSLRPKQNRHENYSCAGAIRPIRFRVVSRRWLRRQRRQTQQSAEPLPYFPLKFVFAEDVQGATQPVLRRLLHNRTLSYSSDICHRPEPISDHRFYHRIEQLWKMCRQAVATSPRHQSAVEENTFRNMLVPRIALRDDSGAFQLPLH